MIKLAERTVNVGIIGFGTVGGGTAKLLTDNAEIIRDRADTRIKIKRIYDKKESWAKERAVSMGLSPELFTDSVDNIIAADDIDVVVEVIGGIEPAMTYIKTAIIHGKSVVTANKDLMASFGEELLAAAEAVGVDLFFEASVAGGIPIIKAIKESLAANHFHKLMGIVNGTTNYILSEMAASGADFDVCLAQAQALGYAEANPTNDIDGLDAARKMAILASLAFNSRITADMVYVEGIKNITKWDIAYANELGYTIKLLGIAKDYEDSIEVRVHPVMISSSHPLATVNDAFNAVFVEADALGKAMFLGRGAGEMPTASAIVGDIISAGKHIVHNLGGQTSCSYFKNKRIRDIKEVECKYYLRLMVADRTMVLAHIADAIGRRDVSLDTVIQKRSVGDLAELVLITHEVKEDSMLQAIKDLNNLAVVDDVVSVIRVDDSDN